MKITKVSAILLRKELSSSMRISRGGFRVRTHAIIEVQTDEGITGLGEGVGDAAMVKAVVDGRMAGLAQGLDPMNIEAVRARLIDGQVYFERKGSAICAASAIEMACWDIKGKALNVPVYQLLGGLYRDRLEAYVSDVYWDDDPKKVAQNAERILGMGFKNIKAHLGCESPKAELARIGALRHVAGDEAKLMIDVNAGYSPIDAREASQLWKQHNLYWLEEPLDPNQIDAQARLRSISDITIAAGENEYRLHSFKQLFDAGAIDVAMPDIGRVGGIQETRNICVLADAYGIPVSPHNFSSGVLLAATIHLMASTPNATLLEFDSSGNAIYEELLEAPLKIENGFVNVPSNPGLGVRLPQDVLRRHAAA